MSDTPPNEAPGRIVDPGGVVYPDPPRRIVEPIADAPAPAACVECTIAGDDALTAAAKRGRKTPVKDGLTTPSDDEAAE